MRRDGTTVAIQCKLRQGQSGLAPNDVQKFSGASSHPVFDERWLTLRGSASKSSREAAVRYDVVLKDFDSGLDEVRRAESVDADDPRTAWQEQAIADCVRVLREGLPELAGKWARDGEREGWMPDFASRASLVMPCGTGKTRVSAEIVLTLCDTGNDLAVVFVPSIALVSQLRSEYLAVLRRHDRSASTLAVCSDKTAGHVGKSEAAKTDPTCDDGQVHVADADCRCISDPEEIARWLQEGDAGLRIIFSTYQSGHHVSEALLSTRRYAQVLVMDEAHRTAQLRPAKSEQREERLRRFIMCHDQLLIPARHRLYQTATPRVYGHDELKKTASANKRRGVEWVVDDMHDGAVFGPVASRLSYREAVERKMLSDYRIIAVVADSDTWDEAGRIVQRLNSESAATGDGVEAGALQSDVASWLVFAQALAGSVHGADRPLARHLVFLNRVAKSKELEKVFGADYGRESIRRMVERDTDGVGEPRPMRRYRIRHLDAGHSVSDRKAALRELADGTVEEPQALTNVGIFGEGMDSPNLDSVAILSPRSSPVEIIQIVGRVMRLSPDKSMGYVIVPVLLERNADVECSLAQSETDEAWSNLGKTLQALRAHDGRIEDDISSMLEIHVPALPSEPRRQLLIVRDGPFSDELKAAVFTGANSRKADEAVSDVVDRKLLPDWSNTSAPIEEYLTEAQGFEWVSVEKTEGDDGARYELPDLPDGGRSILDEHPHVMLLKRGHGTPTWAWERPATNERGERDASRTVQAHAPKLLAAGALATNAEKFRKTRESRGAVAGQQPGLPLLPDQWKVVVMEQSGLRGNSQRDFNLLMEPMRRASGHLAAEGLEPTLRAALALEHLQETDQKANACDIASLLFLNAAMLQARLEDSKGRAADLLRESGGRLRVVQCASDPAGTLRRAWTKVLEYDYRPVFRPALNLLHALEQADAIGGTTQALRSIATWAEVNAEHYASMGMEYAGQLFSRVLGNQASDGAFFTRQPAARLMAELALDAMEPVNWLERSEWQRLKVVDPACGSGTLLSAWLEAAKERIREAGGDEATLQAFHKEAVERLITGLDINPISLQLAAGRLLLSNLNVDYREVRLHEMPYGPDGSNQFSLGSLELLADESFTRLSGASFPGMHAAAVDPRVVEDVQQRSVLLMNPPFSANNKRAAKFTREVRRGMQARELAIRDQTSTADPEAGAVFTSNSIRTLFTPLADKALKAEEGVLAMIMPVTACTGADGTSERHFLATRFHIDAIVSCHHPRDFNLSHNSAINECLLIATRGGGNGPTRFVGLRRLPATGKDVLDVIQAVRAGRDGFGNVCEWPYEWMLEGDWSPVQWFDPELAQGARFLREAPDTRPLGEVYELGPDDRRIRDAFTRVSQADANSTAIPMYDSISKDLHYTMASPPDAHWVPKEDPRKANMAANYLLRRGWAMVASRGRTTNATVSAVCGEEKHLGNRFIPVLTETLQQARAFCVLWNSTPVQMQLLNMRSTKLTYPHWSMDALKSVRLPASLNESETRSLLVGTYRKLCNERLLKWAEADRDPTRHQIDRVAAVAYGMDENRIADWRERLSREPTISNRMVE